MKVVATEKAPKALGPYSQGYVHIPVNMVPLLLVPYPCEYGTKSIGTIFTGICT